MLNNLWRISNVVSVIGLILVTYSYIKLRKALKKLNGMDEEGTVPEGIMSKLIKYQELMFIGTVIIVVSQLVGIFTRPF